VLQLCILILHWQLEVVPFDAHIYNMPTILPFALWTGFSMGPKVLFKSGESFLAISKLCITHKLLSLLHLLLSLQAVKTLILTNQISLPHPLLYPTARFFLWAGYTFWTGLFYRPTHLLR
jgi:hypothetical protein